MDQQPIPRAPSRTDNHGSTRTMNVTGVMPQRTQLTRNAIQCQTPPQVPFPPPVSQNRPLPSIHTSTRIEPQTQTFPSHKIESRHFHSNNTVNRQIFNTHQPLPSHNNEYRPLYGTYALPFSSTYVNLPTGPPLYHSNHNNINAQPHHNLLSPTPLPSLRYPLTSTLPTMKDPPTPFPTYIPILTGRSDWCPWSEALTTAVIDMNLFGHLAEHYNAQWGFDPSFIPTYPPAITPNSSPEELHAWTVWWIRDGQVLHLLVSRLSPSVYAQLPGADGSRPQRYTARSVYRELVRQVFSSTDFLTAAVTRDELIALWCAPSGVPDYIARWRSGLEKLASAGHPFDSADALRYFVIHLPFGTTYDIIRESVLFRLSTARTPDQLPSFESVVERVMNIDRNRSFFQPSCLRHPNPDVTPATTPTKDAPTSTSSTLAVDPAPPARPPRSQNFCTNCRQTGHTIKTCFKAGGGQESGFTDSARPPRSANFCTNCRQTGHRITTCFKAAGGQDGGFTD